MKHCMKMTIMPKPTIPPATVGTIQWIDGVKPVQPNLIPLVFILGDGKVQELGILPE